MAGTSRKRSSHLHAVGSENAIDLLIEDHIKVRQLLERLVATHRATVERKDLLAEIEDEITVHSKIEQEIFYPAYKDAVRTKSDSRLYFEALEEHHVVDLVLSEITSTDTDSEEFGAKAKVLKDLIEHHAEKEETEIFPIAHRALGAQRLRKVGQQLQERKQELTTSMWQRAVEAVTGREDKAA
jgi:hemerythrin-like domain-containing protein